MFAQSRLVFFAGGETPKTPDQRFSEAKGELQSLLTAEDIGINKLARLTKTAEKAISDMPEGKARTNARNALRDLTDRIQAKIDNANTEKEGSLTKGLRKMKESAEDNLVRIKEQAKVTAAQEKVSKYITGHKDYYKHFLNGDDIDGDYRIQLENLMTKLGQVEDKIKAAPNPMDDSTNDASLKQWSDKLIAEAKPFGAHGAEFIAAEKNFSRREAIRAEDRKGTGILNGSYALAKVRRDSGLRDATAETIKTWESMKRPATGSDMSKWEAYQKETSEFIAKYNKNKDEYITQKEAKAQAETAAAEIAKAIDNQLNRKLMGMSTPLAKENSRPVLAAAKEVQAKIDALTAIEPKFGDTSVQAKIVQAKAAVDYHYNSYKGEVAAQEIRKEGGRKTAKVYEDFRKGKYDTFAAFNKAFQEALSDDTTDSEYATGEEKAKSDSIRGKAAKLAEIAKSSLEMKEKIDNFVASAKGTVTSALDSLSKFYEEGKATAEAAKAEPAATELEDKESAEASAIMTELEKQEAQKALKKRPRSKMAGSKGKRQPDVTKQTTIAGESDVSNNIA